VVEHVRAMSAKRLLMGLYAAAPLRAQAEELLAPLTEADPSGELVRTLRRYLDWESSATDTAASLQVHRNTVMQRIDRIRKLLSLDLDDPDDRLVLHLASRVAGVDWDADPS
jgi:DNA-binding PucR family transcriptional regulator